MWLTVAALGTCAFSCESDIDNAEKLNLPETQKTYTGYDVSFEVEEEVLSFSTMSDFQSFMKQATENGDANEDYFADLITKVTKTSDFASLYPHLEPDQLAQSQIDNYVAAAERRGKLIRNVYNTVPSQDDAYDFADFIADPSFAAVLNIDGDIQIAGALYHYTPFGLFVTSTEEGEAEFQSLIADSDRIRSIVESSSSSKGMFVNISDEVEFFVADKPAFSPMPSSDKDAEIAKELNENALSMCGGGNSSTLWNSAFGPSVDCSDYFTDKRRVKTKIFDQNYGIFASLGTNVRSQGKSFGAWWVRSIDELELGTGFFNYDFVFPAPPVPGSLNPYGYPILAAEYGDGTLIGFNGQILNSGPLFSKMKSISQNLPFIPVVDEDWVQLRVFADFGLGTIDQTFSAADYLNFREIVDDYLGSHVPALMARAGRIANNVELIDVGSRTMQVTADILHRNRFNLANMKHYFEFNTGQIGISGNPSVPGGLGPDFTDIMNAYNYDHIRGLVYGAGRDGGTVRGNWVGMEQDN